MPLRMYSIVCATCRCPCCYLTHRALLACQFDLASADLNEVACRFNTTRVPATFVTSTLLQCIAPKSNEGHVDVEVSMNLVDFSSSGVQFQYQAVVCKLTRRQPVKRT